MNLKKAAADHALDYVENGMTVGLGSGSTMTFFLHGLSERLKSGHLSTVVGVPTSEGVLRAALDLEIPVTTLSDHPALDLAVDGADEVDPSYNLIKGLGRALLREKIVAIHAARFVVIVDESKLVSRLGTRGPLPVEIVPFGNSAHVFWLRSLGCRAELWQDGDQGPAETDNGNHLVRCWFADGISDPYGLARSLADRPGVLDHGLFLGMADRVVVGREEGVQVLER